MKKNNLKQSIKFFFFYMVTTCFLTLVLPDSRLSFKSNAAAGAFISIIYFTILGKVNREEDK